MSFKQRLITPIYVSSCQVDKSASDELEWVANHTMTNIIRQLSSLSRHADDLFSDLVRATVDLNQRAANLTTKITILGEHVDKLNATEEEVLFHNVEQQNHFNSTAHYDQQVVSRITMSQAIQDLYNMCVRPPPLDKLNMYRDDDKDCMKFYTDPSYFFELWLLSIQQDIEQRKEAKKKKGKAKKQKRTVQVKPKMVLSIQERNKHKGKGAEFEDLPKHDKKEKVAPAHEPGQSAMTNGDLPPPADMDLPPPVADDATDLPPPPPQDDDDLPPPPPPPPLEEGQWVPPPRPRMMTSPPPPPIMTSPHRVAPPPPPPPTNQSGAPPPPPPPLVENGGTNTVFTPRQPQAPVVQSTPKPDLLSQLREGNKTLKKMEERKPAEKPKEALDVHSMMTKLFVARRQAVVDSDDDDDYDDDDDGEWDED